jgi:hypothetical protein
MYVKCEFGKGSANKGGSGEWMEFLLGFIGISGLKEGVGG